MRDTGKLTAAFFVGLVIASASTLAQSYGRGRNVAFVDGTTISPTNVTASGTGDQFVCTAATAVCEVESSINAATMTSTVPAFDIGPTTTPDANDRLGCFSYGASGAKTRVACVDKEGDLSANTLVATAGSGDAIFLASGRPICMNSASCGAASRIFFNGGQIQTGGGFLSSGDNESTTLFNSRTASGNQAFTCTNVGCRLSLGNTGRYFDDSGTRMQYIGGSFVANVGTSGFFNIDGSGSTLGVQSVINEVNGSREVSILGGKSTSAADSIGVAIRTRAQSVAGAKIVSFQDGTTERASIDYLGALTVSSSIKSGSTLTRGTISLSGGTGTATVLSGAVCVCSRTDAESAVQCAVATTTLTATSGASTGTVAYVCL